MTAPYDLTALLWEVRQTTGGVVETHDLGRLSALVLDRLGCTTAAQAYDRLYADWAALPAGGTASGMRAGQVLAVLPMLRLGQPLVDRAREEELLRAAREHGPADERWQADVLAVNGLFGVQHLREPHEMEEAVRRIEDALAAHPDGPVRDQLLITRAAVRAQLAQLGGGQDDFDAAVAELARLAERPGQDEETRRMMAGQVALFRVHQAMRRHDEPMLADQIRVLEDTLAHLPDGHMDRLAFEADIEAARGYLTVLRARRTGRLEPVPEGDRDVVPAAEVRRRIAELPLNVQADKLGEAAFAQGVRAMIARDHQGFLESLELREAALDLLEPDDDRWIRTTGSLGVGHCALADAGIAPPHLRGPHLDQGVSWLRHTLRLTGGPHHPLWGNTAMSLARGHRARGDLDARVRRAHHDEARRLGLESLRAAAWTVLLQSGTGHAAETARRAGEQAAEVARWCLADGATADAVRALDAGRGLVLHAATVATTVPALLGGLGRADLADEWRAAGGAVPAPDEEALLTGLPTTAGGPTSRLRRRVLEALAASPARARLLDTPAPDAIGQALRALGATALVYLVPGEESGPGAALVVTADAAVRTVALPGLALDAPELTAYRAAGAAGRDAGGPPTAVPPPRPATDGAALARLCDWAGTTVMGPLLATLPRGFGRVPSVVLVPMADLGVVPWHAARVRRRHACQDAAISYTPSARLLCEIASRPATGPRQALVVGDPTRDLHHAGVEAAAIHGAFHADGELLGPGEATPAAVTGWLARQRGGLLHLACHGEVRTGGRHSAQLLLSGGTLAAEELTEGADRYDGLDLVVLAACRTNVSGRGHDEAYSLATAFLVAGARSVVGSLWPVPDEATSLLMYLTHHHLVRDGLTPGQALRRAQLWMLDDHRRPPPGMPAELRERVARIRADDLTSWAGFTHLGR